MHQDFPLSSTVVAADYDEESSTLVIQFKGGRYRYSGVPVDVFEGLCGAPSAGAYVNSDIKGRFPYTKVG